MIDTPYHDLPSQWYLFWYYFQRGSCVRLLQQNKIWVWGLQVPWNYTWFPNYTDKFPLEEMPALEGGVYGGILYGITSLLSYLPNLHLQISRYFRTWHKQPSFYGTLKTIYSSIKPTSLDGMNGSSLLYSRYEKMQYGHNYSSPCTSHRSGPPDPGLPDPAASFSYFLH